MRRCFAGQAGEPDRPIIDSTRLQAHRTVAGMTGNPVRAALARRGY